MKQEFIIFSNQLEHIWISFLHKIPAIIIAFSTGSWDFRD